MRFVIKGRDGVYKSTVHRLKSADEELHDLSEASLDNDFERWYKLWKLTGKCHIDSRFQQPKKTPLAK